MKAKSMLMMSLIAAGSFASQVNAQELSLEGVVGSFINQAMVSTAHELELGVKQAVANTTHLFELNEVPVGHVKVTDLAAQNTSSSETKSRVNLTRTQN